MTNLGCAGCHEIAGLEDEGPISTELTKEGSKPLEQLDFVVDLQSRSLIGNPAHGGEQMYELY